MAMPEDRLVLALQIAAELKREGAEAMRARIREAVDTWDPDDDFGLDMRKWTSIRRQLLWLIDALEGEKR